jgi:uncharacterized phage-associated protein
MGNIGAWAAMSWPRDDWLSVWSLLSMMSEGQVSQNSRPHQPWNQARMGVSNAKTAIQRFAKLD